MGNASFDRGRQSSSQRLAILLPTTSRRTGSHDSAGHDDVSTVLDGLQTVAASLKLLDSANDNPHLHHTDVVDTKNSERKPSSPLMVFVGVDHDDTVLLQHEQQLLDVFSSVGVPARFMQFDAAVKERHGPGAVCKLWGVMATAALEEGCNLAVLLGDDTEVQPVGWPTAVVSAFAEDPQLMLLLLKDAADPGFPSFPVLRLDTHMQLHGRKLLPDCFENQGGDPYLAALYRRWVGCVRMLPDVTVVNRVGGVQRADKPYTEPRYERTAVSKRQMLEELSRGTKALADAVAAHSTGALTNIDRPSSVSAHDSSSSILPVQLAPCGEACPTSSSGNSNSSSQPLSSWKQQLAVDVLVPTARLNLDLLEGIAQAVLSPPGPAGAHLSLIVVVDKPLHLLTPKECLWLQQLQDRWLDRVRVRVNARNMGASATRNRALQESLAEYVIMWDDDIKPSADCLAAYVQAFKKHDKALGFAGPSYIPKAPDNLWCCAVHQADVLFFWDAAENWEVAEVMPWAVTANVAFFNTAEEFDLRFPKTGGGEDIDYCLKVTGGRLVPVPQASVHHPLWNNGSRCYNRFFGWALGDGALITMYPELCYWSAPNSAETCAALLLLAGAEATAALSLLLISTAAASAAGLYHSLLLPAHQLVLQTPLLAAAGPVTGVVGGASSELGAWMAAAATHSAGMAGRWSVVLLVAAVVFKLMDAVLDVARAFTAERVSKHPCSSWWLRAAAATEASLIKTWSECGRLWGLKTRGELLQGTVCRRFDWFGGLCAEIVAAEQRSAVTRFLVCGAAAVGAAVAVACVTAVKQ